VISSFGSQARPRLIETSIGIPSKLIGVLSTKARNFSAKATAPSLEISGRMSANYSPP